MATEEDLKNLDFVRGYAEGRDYMSLYAHARLHRVLSYVENEMKELFKEETNNQGGGK
jgi:hypothetical protein